MKFKIFCALAFLALAASTSPLWAQTNKYPPQTPAGLLHVIGPIQNGDCLIGQRTGVTYCISWPPSQSALPLATSTMFGVIKPDNVTTTVTAGVLSVVTTGISGPAAGDLGNTYPNPSVLSLAHTITGPPAGVVKNLGVVTTGTWNAGTIGAAYGGTGLVSPTVHGIMIGEGSGPMTSLACTTTGSILTSNGSLADPSCQVPGSQAFYNATAAATAYQINSTTVLAFPDADTQSIGVGNGALTNQNSTLLGNVGVGYLACNSVTSGSSNTCLGFKTGQSGTMTGTQNTLIGSNAGNTLTTGSGNTFAGYQSAFTTTVTGSNNSLYGSFSSLALGSTTSASGFGNLVVVGSKDTAVGARALAATATNNNANAAFGFNAGSKITTGTTDVIIGPNVASTTLTIGSNNILIGTTSALDTTTSSISNTFAISGGSTSIISATAINATPTVTVPGNLIVSGTCSGCSTAVIVGGTAGVGVAQASTNFAMIGVAAGESSVYTIMPSGSLKNLQVKASSSLPSGQTAIFTMRKNGVDTSLTCTITGTADMCTDTTHSVTAAGEVYDVKIVTSATTGTLSYNFTFTETFP